MISKGNHVKLAHFVLLADSEKQKHDFQVSVPLTVVTIFFPSMYNKTIIRFGFCDIQNNLGRGRGSQPKPNITENVIQ